MNVAESVGRTLARCGLRQVFGVVGSGNFHVTNALIASGAHYVAARHEAGAATMADAYARMSGTVSAVTVHQGCGLTNALTGITEAAKSRTPMLVLAAETTAPRSNFFVDQPGLADAIGAHSARLTSAETATQDAARAYAMARDERRTVVLNLPLEVQAEPAPDASAAPAAGPVDAPGPTVEPSTDDIATLVTLLSRAERPVIVAGRGARHAGAELTDLAEACGALLATSAVAKGLFTPNPWSLDVSGGFASPLAAELIAGADVIVGFGCMLNMWTMRHGRLVGAGTTVAQVDIEPDAIGVHRRVDHGIVGDSARVAAAAAQALWDLPEAPEGYRSDAILRRLREGLRWRDVPYEDWSTGTGGDARIDPRTLTIELDDLLPEQRVVAVDSGNFMGYPSAYLSVPDENGFCFTQSFQSIGLGLATAIGSALAQPERLPVAALGDGGTLMAAAELDTVRRLGLPMVVVVYNDEAYGAEVHHFADGAPLDTVTFPETDIAAIGAGYGFDSATVRTPADLAAVAQWLAGSRERPLLVDAKIATPQGAWWLEEAFRGH
ncbi:thiamine pyrophosphate-binding protein [Phytoactinopolyspora halotolerans]|uniref:Thiamine pyrophosphate-binding protein n=1 Tax=Phytoactinopolyspora halotolerans TaxID=1981512 RepID=A0A6L9SEZ6_9ACTN|nr:thiamine pyrophosphate-binding protein [Phytoactinopolyspora halotolerans]NEE04005.1 thiamine pyrophosphate-binding protein [Phytoactinopolyspora halotolerans]